MLATGMEILSKARREGYGVGAFNVNDMEFVQAVLEAADEVRSPVLLALSEGAMKYGGKALFMLVREMGKEARVPVCIHLDHGSSYESCMKAIQAGFTSVMIDKSHDDAETNARETRRVVQTAHALGVTVEAEIGRLGGVEEHVVVSEEDAFLTNPDEAAWFMEHSGADYLAVAVGTSHGAFKGKGRPFIDHARIEKIAAKLPNNPLVMHGASGVPQELVERFRAAGGSMGEAVGIHPDDIRKGIAAGIAKINTDTDLRLGFVTKVRELLGTNPKEIDPRKFLGPARDEMKAIVKARMELFGSAGKG
ncbi:MAG: class II fructose-1,6-bisphosphate aldolase [Meiothermus sp.]|nr:class II fructose-1,6-bisphosphate aldolase [Meiothermus sp.]